MRLEAHFFGTSDFADAWRTALRLPNALRNLMGEGTLSASMVPVYSEFLVQGRHAEAKRFAGAVSTAALAWNPANATQPLPPPPPDAIVPLQA